MLLTTHCNHNWLLKRLPKNEVSKGIGLQRSEDCIGRDWLNRANYLDQWVLAPIYNELHIYYVIVILGFLQELPPPIVVLVWNKHIVLLEYWEEDTILNQWNFHQIGPLGRFNLVVAMSVCVFVPFSCTRCWGLFCPHFLCWKEVISELNIFVGKWSKIAA